MDVLEQQKSMRRVRSEPFYLEHHRLDYNKIQLKQKIQLFKKKFHLKKVGKKQLTNVNEVNFASTKEQHDKFLRQIQNKIQVKVQQKDYLHDQKFSSVKDKIYKDLQNQDLYFDYQYQNSIKGSLHEKTNQEKIRQRIFQPVTNRMINHPTQRVQATKNMFEYFKSKTQTTFPQRSNSHTNQQNTLQRKTLQSASKDLYNPLTIRVRNYSSNLKTQ